VLRSCLIGVVLAVTGSGFEVPECAVQPFLMG
jgi:hypothetical protein